MPIRTLPWLTVILAAALAAARPAGPAKADVPSESTRRLGVHGMPEPHNASLLVGYYEQFLRDQDIDGFRGHVSARYLEGTLIRLTEASEAQARRAAILALGLVGTYHATSAVARALRDPDTTVRGLAENALWAIWFRSDSPENNSALAAVSQLIGRQRFDEAVAKAGRLIERSPQFAEAYNQRAIAQFHLGAFRESADDCRQALERNPFHIGALSGLAKCLLRLEQRDEALEVLKRASKLQPYNEDLRGLISALETGTE